MKTRYIVLILLLVALCAAFVYVTITAQVAGTLLVENILQGVGLCVALISGVIALSVADPRPREIKARFMQERSSNFSKRHKKQLSDELAQYYNDFPDPFETARINFRIQNTSSFALKNPTISITLLRERMHPSDGCPPLAQREFRTNLWNSKENMRIFGDDELVTLSNCNLPYWNVDVVFALWVRVVIKDRSSDSVKITLSLNCDNAEGITEDFVVTFAENEH